MSVPGKSAVPKDFRPNIQRNACGGIKRFAGIASPGPCPFDANSKRRVGFTLFMLSAGRAKYFNRALITIPERRFEFAGFVNLLYPEGFFAS